MLSTVLENLVQLRPDHPLVRRLVDLLLDGRLGGGSQAAWASATDADPHLVQPSVAHTARAVVALRAATADAARPEVRRGDAGAALGPGRSRAPRACWPSTVCRRDIGAFTGDTGRVRLDDGSDWDGIDHERFSSTSSRGEGIAGALQRMVALSG